MKKRCTNSACRRVFRISENTRQCPYCGKTYARLVASNAKVEPVAWSITIPQMDNPLMTFANLTREFGYSLMDLRRKSQQLPMTFYSKDKEKVRSFVKAVTEEHFCTVICTPVYRKKRNTNRSGY